MSCMAEAGITIEVAYALPERQRIVRLTVPEYTRMLDAVRLSGITEHFPGLDIENSAMGVFGKAVASPAEYVLADGDRVEIYRPLIADPKEVRRQRAARAREALRGD